jgi:hypothetical protein
MEGDGLRVILKISAKYVYLKGTPWCHEMNLLKFYSNTNFSSFEVLITLVLNFSRLLSLFFFITFIFLT